MKTASVFVALLFLALPVHAQIAQGPASGSIPSGASTTTDNFEPEAPGAYPGPIRKPVHNTIPVYPKPMPAGLMPAAAPEGANYYDYDAKALTGPPPVVIRSFAGIAQTNSIPPDPHMAAGPDHIIQVVNTSFRICDKSGTVLKTIGADSWYSNVLANPGAFDPKVQYDHFAGRWIMVWLNQNDATSTSYYLVSVSDDADPIGTWYNWAIPSNVNGSTATGTWADYQGVGYDNDAFYFTSNTFSFSTGNYGGVKVRILPKAQFYANTAGAISWQDFWNLKDNSNFDMFGTRPAVIYGLPGVFYLVGKPNLTGGNYFVVFRISNPLTTPSISATHVAVTSWSNAPNAGQLGGGSLALEGGSSHIRCEPIYRDSSLWLVHSVANGPYSSLRYVRISTVSNTAIEDVAFGSAGYWHFYTALAVDQDKNIAMTFSRSGDDEYAGAFMTWRLATDPVGTLRDAQLIQPGAGNYVKDFGSGRNRWGDYNGVALDPVDQNNFWMETEYAAGTNTWGVWINNTRLVPFPGARVSSSLDHVDFGLVEVGNSSVDTTTVVVSNVGAAGLTISGITRTSGAYGLLDLPSFPATIATYDSIKFRVYFRPTAHGVVDDTIRIASNDATNPSAGIALHAKGIIIGRAQVGVMYAAGLANPIGSLYAINMGTGAATPIGPLGINEVQTLAIRPSNNELIGTRNATGGTEFFRLSSDHGDALSSITVPIVSMRAIAFAGDTLWGATTTGRLYRINIDTGDTIGVGTASPVPVYSGLAVDPTTTELYASVRPAISGRDRIYRVNKATGQATLIGATGFGSITPGIAFDKNGTLFGLVGSGSAVANFVTIDKSTGTGTVIGSTGIVGLNGIALRTDSLTSSVSGDVPEGIPESYVLEQNYPNPFNPVTQIRYALPVGSHVRLAIFNLVGQEIARLVDDVQSAGYHVVTWDGTTASGLAAASGVYLYKLEGKGFVTSKKMLLLK